MSLRILSISACVCSLISTFELFSVASVVDGCCCSSVVVVAPAAASAFSSSA
jgi:hypothetical protein